MVEEPVVICFVAEIPVGLNQQTAMGIVLEKVQMVTESAVGGYGGNGGVGGGFDAGGRYGNRRGGQRDDLGDGGGYVDSYGVGGGGGSRGAYDSAVDCNRSYQ